MGLPAGTMVEDGKSANGAPSSDAAKYDLPPHFIGGSHLGVASPGKVKDFVASHGGHTVITNVSLTQREMQQLSGVQVLTGEPSRS